MLSWYKKNGQDARLITTTTCISKKDMMESPHKRVCLQENDVQSSATINLFTLIPTEVLAIVFKYIPLHQVVGLSVTSHHFLRSVCDYLQLLTRLDFSNNWDFKRHHCTAKALTSFACRCPCVKYLKLAQKSRDFRNPSVIIECVKLFEKFKTNELILDNRNLKFAWSDQLELAKAIPSCLMWFSGPIKSIQELIPNFKNVRSLEIKPEPNQELQAVDEPLAQSPPWTALRELQIRQTELKCDLPFLNELTPLKKLIIDQSTLPDRFYELASHYSLSHITLKDCSITTDQFRHLLKNCTSTLTELALCGCAELGEREVMHCISRCENLSTLRVGLTYIDLELLTELSANYGQLTSVTSLQFGGMSDLDHPDIVFVYGSLQLLDKVFPHVDTLVLADQIWIEWPMNAEPMMENLTCLHLDVVYSEETLMGFLKSLPNLKVLRCDELQPDSDELTIASSSLEYFHLTSVLGSLSVMLGDLPKLFSIFTVATDFEIVGECPSLNTITLDMHEEYRPQIDFSSFTKAPNLRIIRVYSDDVPDFDGAKAIRPYFPPEKSFGCIIVNKPLRILEIHTEVLTMLSKLAEGSADTASLYVNGGWHILKTAHITSIIHTPLDRKEQQNDATLPINDLDQSLDDLNTSSLPSHSVFLFFLAGLSMYAYYL